MRERRPFAGKDQDRLRQLDQYSLQHPQQKVDVLLVRHAAHVHQRRLLRSDIQALAKAHALAALEAFHFHPRRHDVHRTLDTIVAQRPLHRAGRHDQRIQRTALRTREVPRDEAHECTR